MFKKGGYEKLSKKPLAGFAFVVLFCFVSDAAPILL